jgi:hypothetical protein
MGGMEGLIDSSDTNGGAESQASTRTPMPDLRCRPQQLRFDPQVRSAKPSPSDVFVIALGSRFIRYGRAHDPVPHRIRAIAAFPRRASAIADTAICSVLSTATTGDTASDGQRSHLSEFNSLVSQIANDAELQERRRGGGKPIPWEVLVEPVDVPDLLEKDVTCPEENGKACVGRAAERVLHTDEDRMRLYDIVEPIADGRMAWSDNCSAGLIRAALDAILGSIGVELHGIVPSHRPGLAEQMVETEDVLPTSSASKALLRFDAATYITLIVPDTADRADVAEYVSALFRVVELRAAAVFVHHNSVSSALSAGLTTCAVVDIGYSATTIACVEEGCVLGDSRVHLQYGSRAVLAAFDRLLRQSGAFDKATQSVSAYKGDLQAVVSKACEQLCAFNVDENDTLSIAMIRAPSSGKMFRVKCGVGVRAVPALGLVHPKLLQSISSSKSLATGRRSVPTSDRNDIDDNFMIGLFGDIKKSAIVTAAVPLGLMANEAYSREYEVDDPVHPLHASLVDAILWSVNRAVETSVVTQVDTVRGTELKRRYFNSILLVGGGSSIHGIAIALEGRLRRLLDEVGILVNDVTVIDGAKGSGVKVDEDALATSSAQVKVENNGNTDLDEDGDPACLPWKGGAVMVEADALKESWLYRDDWEERGVRALRERVPFSW